MSTATATNFRPIVHDDLRSLAHPVYLGGIASQPSRELGWPSAADAAQALAGLAAWVGHRRGSARMREVMTELVRHTDAWRVRERPFQSLPALPNGRVDEDVVLVASVVCSLVRTFGLVNLRAAMAFWAVETDPAAHQRVVEA